MCGTIEFFCEDEKGIFDQKMSEGLSNLEKVLYESLIKSYISQKAVNSLHIGGRR
jgi:hypothetical protein